MDGPEHHSDAEARMLITRLVQCRHELHGRVQRVYGKMVVARPLKVPGQAVKVGPHHLIQLVAWISGMAPNLQSGTGLSHLSHYPSGHHTVHQLAASA